MSYQTKRAAAAVAMLAGTIALLLPAHIARAQAFTFNTGYNTASTNNGLLPTLNTNGTTPAGETTYSIGLSGGVSSTSSIYAKGGADIRNNTTATGSPFRAIAGGFVLPANTTATISTLSFDVYVINGPTDTTGISNLFTGAYYGVYAGYPYNAANPTPVDGSFTSALAPTSITTTYEGVRLPPGSTTDTSRTLYNVTLNLGNTFTTPLSSSMNVADPRFFFGVSLDQNTSFGAGSDVNIAYATATSNTNGQPAGTNGDAVVYNSGNGFQTDNPNNQTTAQQQLNPILSAFAMQVNGFISTSALPEPNALFFALSVLPVAATGFALRRHKARVV